jgi:hypothetical protein
MAAVGVASGCGDQQQQLPSAPEYHIITGTGSGCDSTHLKQLVNAYFSAPEQQVVRSLLSSMLGQTAFSSTAKSLGFDIMTHVDAVVSAGTAGDPGVGSDLLNHLILCMYNPATEATSYPATFPEDFTIPLTPSLHGAFKVKPTSTTDVAPVLSRPVSTPFSGVGPSSGTWAAALSANTPVRVLLYGRPGSTSTSYNWKTLPHDGTFNPPVIVAVCVDPATETTSLLNEENVGLLPFVDAPFLVPGTCSSIASLDLGSPATLAHHLVRFGASLLGPPPLWAAALSPGGLGGLGSGIRSEFGPSDVDHVTLTFVQQPTSTKVNTVITPAVTILATGSLVGGGSKPVPNVSITIAATNNNGTPAILTGTKTQVTNAAGIAAYADLFETKSGGYRLVVTAGAAQVGGRPEIPVGSAASAKFNISPK